MNAQIVVVKETPRDAAHRLARSAIKGQFKIEAIHPYKTASGEHAYWRWRARTPDGGKVIRPFYWSGTAYVPGEPVAPATGKLLYRLPELLAADPEDPVYIVEGEACVDRLRRLGLVAITSGSSSSANGADWGPLDGRSCVIWPDQDAPGWDYLSAVTKKVQGIASAVRWIDSDELNLPEHGDCVDWLQTHPEATAASIHALPIIVPPSLPFMPATEPVCKAPRVILTCGSDVEPEPIDWLWNGWLAAGKFHLIGGAPGTGKTTIAATLAAIVSSGGCWPDGTHAAGGSVVFWSGEDDNADTLNPRLRAAGANMSKVFMVNGVIEDGERYPFDPARDMDALRAALTSIPDVRLIVIDPIVSAVVGDSHKNAEVRRGLQPLVDVAGELQCALLGVTHFSKGTSGRDPVERITGSLAFGALARVVMVTAKQEGEGDQQERRVMLRAKSNIGPDGGGFAYELQQGELSGYLGVSASSVAWGESIRGTARQLLAEAEQMDDEQDSAVDAMTFLQTLLAFGARSAKDIQAEAKAAGIGWRTVERVKKKAGVKTRKNGMNGGWEWYRATNEADVRPLSQKNNGEAQ